MDLLSTVGGNSSLIVLVLAVFGATAVEMVEALTIVVAVGVTRGWRCALQGAASAVALLAVLVAVGGVPLIRYTPIDALRVAVGALLLLLGLGWLRKAVLRAGGILPVHDENAIYADTVDQLSKRHDDNARAAYTEGFGVAFKGVFLEGIEVVLVVISLGASQHRLLPASAAAAAAAVLVAGVGAVVARQLSGVPENLLKLVVGVMLTSFGTFWIGEGAGAHWPASDASLPVLIGAFALLSVALIAWTRRSAAFPRDHSLKESQRVQA